MRGGRPTLNCVNEPSRPNLSWLWYTLIRLGLFALVLAILLILLPVEPWISAIVAAIIALCVSYIFFSRPRAAVSEQLAEARRRPRDDGDDYAEDSEVGSSSEREGGTEADPVDQPEQAREAERQDELPRGLGGHRDETRRDGEQ